MLKVRVTFIDNEKGKEELNKIISLLKDKLSIISQSEIYKGRGKSLYSNIYIDVETDK